MAITAAYGFGDNVFPEESFQSGSSGFAGGVTTNGPRTGLRCFSVGGPNTQQWRINFPASYQIGRYYTAVRPLAFVTGGDGGINLYLMDNGTAHLRLTFTSTGQLRLYHGNGTLLQTGTTPHVANEYIQMAIRYSIDDTTGVLDVYLDGASTPEISYAGDTMNGANAFVNQFMYEAIGFQLPTGNSGLNIRVADVVIQDDTGSAPENGHLGDIACDTLFPTADGDETDWTIAGSAPAATRWESVDELGSDGDVTAVDSNVVGDKVLFQYPALSTLAGTIFAAIPNGYMRKLSAGTREVAFLSKLGGVEEVGSTINLSTSFLRKRQVFHRNPSGAVWISTDTPQFGAEVIT